MFDKEQFKKDFLGQSIAEMIDYIISKKSCLKEDLINVGIKSRLERRKWPKPKQSRKTIKYFIRIGFIAEHNGIIEFNKKFMPRNQK